MTTGQFPGLPAYPVRQRLEIGGVNAVLLAVPPEQHYPQNLFGLNAEGDVLWQVEPRSSPSSNPEYVSIRDALGTIAARSGDGFERTIDPASGKVLSEEPVVEEK